MPPHFLPRPSRDLQAAVLAALRGEAPTEAEPGAIAAALARYECGGYLHRLRPAAPRALPAAWAAAAERTYRRTLVDTLAAVAALREAGDLLRAAGVRFVLLKGAAYLADLYDDLGCRALTDVDILIPRSDVGRAARRLREAGFAGEVGPQFPEDRRFEMHRPGPGACWIEIHWTLGVPGRMRIDQEGIWSAARPGNLDGRPCLLLPVEEAVLYHAGHAADHYFGHTLKWAIDLRLMLERWRPDPGRLASLARVWGLRTALHLALLQVERLFPGAAPADLRAATAPGSLRGALLRRFLSDEPAEMFRLGPGDRGRVLLRPLLMDSVRDALAVSLRVAARPLAAARRRRGEGARPWEAAETTSGGDGGTRVDPSDPRMLR